MGKLWFCVEKSIHSLHFQEKEVTTRNLQSPKARIPSAPARIERLDDQSASGRETNMTSLGLSAKRARRLLFLGLV